MKSPSIEKFDFIDALRGVAILGVILVHSSQFAPPGNTILLNIMAEGARGVQLFYIASAITLCMSWSTRSTIELYPVRNFIIRRFFRIAPMFYVAIIIYCIIGGLSKSYWAPNGIEWWFIPVTVMFLHGFHPETITSIVPGGWSIAVEMMFYLLFPYLFTYISSIRKVTLLFFASIFLYVINKILAPIIFSYPPEIKYLESSFTYFNFFGQFPVLVIGIICYYILRSKIVSRWNLPIGGLLFLISTYVFCYPVKWMPHHIVSGVIFLLIALFLANWPIRLLVNQFTTTIGKLSYSMYLNHFLVLIFLSKFRDPLIFSNPDYRSLFHFFVTVFLTASISYITYVHIEKPFIKIGKNLINKYEFGLLCKH